MDTRLVVSSQTLLKKLQNMSFWEDDHYAIAVTHKTLHVQGEQIDVINDEEGRFQISGKSFNNLTRLLKSIPDQPVTLQLSSSSSITVTDILT